MSPLMRRRGALSLWLLLMLAVPQTLPGQSASARIAGVVTGSWGGDSGRRRRCELSLGRTSVGRAGLPAAADNAAGPQNGMAQHAMHHRPE